MQYLSATVRLSITLDLLNNHRIKLIGYQKKVEEKRAPNYKNRIKASRRWKKANKAVAKIQSKVARQRQNWQHQVASDIVRRNSFVATEKLNLKNLTRKAKKGSKRKLKRLDSIAIF